jgi:hypothetical protein
MEIQYQGNVAIVQKRLDKLTQVCGQIVAWCHETASAPLEGYLLAVQQTLPSDLPLHTSSVQLIVHS